MNHTKSIHPKSQNKFIKGVHLSRMMRCLILLVFMFSMVGAPVNPVQAQTVTFTAGELLGNPTDESITINIVPASNIQYKYEYDVDQGEPYAFSTGTYNATGGQPHEITITGLSANTRYYYRMVYDGDESITDGDYEVRDEHTFHTQRAEGSSFKFTVVSDSHAQFNTSHQNAMLGILGDTPDFHLDLGDTFYTDNQTSQSAVNNDYLDYRRVEYMGRIGPSVPIFVTPGNHENEEGWNFDDAFSIALASVQARKAYFPTPLNDGFYSANTDPLSAIDEAIYGDEYREDYYAWEWGDALFVVIDEYQYTMDLPYNPTAGESNEAVTGDQWSWTLGLQQYTWLKQTLENSDAKYKFVFSHHVTGGIPRTIAGVGAGYVRGGAEAAAYFEWGGNNADGTWGFDDQRPGWGGVPIHQLFVANGVSAYFHGHDHQYVYETRDGVVYQEVPSPSLGGSGFSGIYTEGATATYNTIEILPNNGYLRLNVAPAQTTVEYVTSNDTSKNVQYTYTILPNTPSTDPTITITGTPLSAFSSTPGTPSAEQSYTVSGSNLTANITITPPADFEISTTSGSGWTTSPIILTQSGGDVPATPIYVRFNRATQGTSSGDISHTSSGATTKTVAVSGTAAVPVPTITITGTPLTSFNSAPGTPSAEQSYSVSGSNLTANITITPPTDFQVSQTSGSGWASNLTLNQSGGTVPSTPIYVRFNRATAGTSNGNITHTSSGATTQNVAVSGTASEGGTGVVTLEGDYSSGTADGVSSINVAHTTGTGADRLMLVGVSSNSYNGAQTISSVTFTPSGQGAIGLSLVGSRENEAGRLVAIYSLLNPPGGVSGTVTVTYSGTVSYGIIVGVQNFAGVDQDDPLDDFASAVGTESAPISVDVTADTNDLVFDTVFIGAATIPTLTAGSNQDQLWSTNVDRAGGAASTEPAASTVTMSWTPSGGATAYYWTIGAVPINPAEEDVTNPTVTIEQASGQNDPTSAKTVNFTVQFSESVTGFETGDVYIGGSAPGTLVGTVTGSGATYNVAVTGMTNSGIIATSIPAGVAQDSAGNPNEVSNSTDNIVTYNHDTTAPTVTINQASGQADPTSTSPVNFTVVFSEPVEDFATGDVTLGGPTGASIATVTGSGTTYNVAVSGMNASGTITASLAAGVAHDEGGNGNTASTSSDNTVTFEYTGPTIQHIANIGSNTTKTSGTSLTVTTTQAVAAGDTIVVGYATDPAQDLVVTVTDSAGNTYEQVALAVNWGNGRSYIFAAYDVDPLPSGGTITITGDQSVTAKAAVVSVFRGLAQINVLDQSLGNPRIEDETTQSGTTPNVGPTGMTTQADELLIGVIGTEGPVGDTAGTWSNSFSAGPRAGTTGGDANTNWTVSLGYRIVSSTGAYTAQKSGVTSRNWAATIATFKSENSLPPNSYNIVLGRPTDESVTVNALFTMNGQVYYQYGILPGNYTAGSTSPQSVTADTPVETVIPSLTANQQYYYRPVFQESGSSTWVPGAEHSFHTQRDLGETFTFTIISDSHLGQTFSSNDPARYEQTTMNVAADQPDFHLDLGDAFIVSTDLGVGTYQTGTQAQVDDVYEGQRPYFGNFSHSAPVFLAIGNHENEEGWNFDDTPFSRAHASVSARKLYFPNPVPDGFYSGNTNPLPVSIQGDTNREDYYAWEWGDALLIVLDPFQYTMTKPYGSITGSGEDDDETVDADQWNWTLGQDQYDWFKQTLESSNAKYKFVFSHHVVGGQLDVSGGAGAPGYVRGGALAVPYFEWGGNNSNGTWGFTTERPGWGDDPIHQLMIDNGVSAFFHGHDHQYVHEVRDGIVYQLVPSPGMTGSGFDLYTSTGYVVSGGNLPNAGHIRATVSPDETLVEYVRSAISGDTGVTNGQIDHPYTIEPSVTLDCYPLTLSHTGEGSNPVASPTNSTGCPSNQYLEGEPISLSGAAAATGWHISGWTGTSNNGSTASTNSLTMPASSHTASVIYERNTVTLTVNVSGSGNVNRDDPGPYLYGDVVELTAVPETGWHFANWTGDLTGSDNPETITLNGNRTVTAVFAKDTVTLTVNVNGSGSVNRDDNGPYEYGDVVQLTAVPGTGSHFVNWTGDLTGSVNPDTVTLTGNKTVTANFAKDTVTLTVNVNGSGSVNRDDNGPYEYGDVVQLTAVASAGSHFVNWTGDLTGSVNPDSITLDGNKTVTANFTQDEYTLTVNTSGNGSVTKDPEKTTYTYGEDVELTANPEAGWTFSGWSGDLTGSVNPETITMDGNKTVTAQFTEIGVPPLPSGFYGEIHILDNPPSLGGTVEAYVPGKVDAVATTAITEFETDLVYTMDIPGNTGSGPKDGGIEGDIVTFMIAGRVVATGVWHSGTNVELNFHPPQALPGGPYNGDAGVPVNFSGNANDWGSDATTYEWDWDNDGAYDETGQNPSHTWNTAGNYTVGLRVTDAQGGEGAATTTIEVIVTAHSIDLVAGWNLVSFHVHPADTATASVLDSIAGNYDLVYAWDAAGGHPGSGNWVKYDPNVGFGNTLTALDETMGFWIHMTTADTLVVQGSAPRLHRDRSLDGCRRLEPGGVPLRGSPYAAGSLERPRRGHRFQPDLRIPCG